MAKGKAYASRLVNGICRATPSSETHRIVLFETNPNSDGTGFDLCDNYSPVPSGGMGNTYCNTNYFGTATTTGSITNTTAITFLFSGDESVTGVGIYDIANSDIAHWVALPGGSKSLSTGETLRMDIASFTLTET